MNSIHHIEGWKNPTRYIHVQLKNGVRDTQNKKYMFGIRKFDVHGIQSKISDINLLTYQQIMNFRIKEVLLDSSQWKAGVVNLLTAYLAQK